MKLIIVFSLLMSVMYFSIAEDAPKVAVASIIRGDVELLIMGKTLKLKKDDWVKEGSVVKTADKSFVKLIFIDKSQMNIGPNSEMKIAKFSGNESGIIDLVKGKIRSQVTKDYLQMKDKDKSKMFIKTPNAVMGIRGTDFLIAYDDKAATGKDTQGNSSFVLFEGDISVNKLTAKNVNDSNKLEDIVNLGVRVHPGEFTVVDPVRPNPTVPAILNVEQREALEKNISFDKREPSNASSDEAKKTTIPGGLNSEVVSSKSATLEKEIGNAANNDTSAEKSDGKSVDGYVIGDKVKPADGSVLSIDTGSIIPPGPDSALDKYTDSYGLSQGIKIESDGSVSIKGGEINSDGKLMMSVVGADGKVQIVTRDLPPPIKLDAPLVVNTFTPPPIGTAPLPGIQTNPDITLNPDGTSILAPPPSGGIMNVNDAVQQLNQKTKTTINAN